MVGFGPKQAWLAVRDGQPADLAAALGLRDLGPVGWREGVDLAYLTDDRVVLTPPLPGAAAANWLLVTGRWLLRPDTPVQIAPLSGRLRTEVQFFATYRVRELHSWQRAVDGALIRAFGYLGETGEILTWQGAPDADELAIGLPPEPADDADLLVGEADVLRLASAWSVDPTDLDGRPAAAPLRAAATP